MDNGMSAVFGIGEYHHFCKLWKRIGKCSCYKRSIFIVPTQLSIVFQLGS